MMSLPKPANHFGLPFNQGGHFVDEKQSPFSLFKPQFSPPPPSLTLLSKSGELSNLSTKSLDLSSNSSSVDSSSGGDLEQPSLMGTNNNGNGVYHPIHHHRFEHSSRANFAAAAAAADCDSIDLRIETKKNQDRAMQPCHFANLFSGNGHGSGSANSSAKSPSSSKSEEEEEEEEEEKHHQQQQKPLVIAENGNENELENQQLKRHSSTATRSPSGDHLSTLPGLYFRSASPDGDSSSSSSSSSNSSCSSNGSSHSNSSLNLTVAVGSEESDRLVVDRIAPNGHTVVTIHHGHQQYHHHHHQGKAAALKDYSINSIMREQFGVVGHHHHHHHLHPQLESVSH